MRNNNTFKVWFKVAARSLGGMVAGGMMVIGFMGTVSADVPAPRTVNLWECSLNEGKTMADVYRANSNWLKYVNAEVAGGGISSYVLTPLVGTRATFKYVDSYPSLKAWTAVTELDSPTMAQLDAVLDETATCASNTLHRSIAS